MRLILRWKAAVIAALVSAGIAVAGVANATTHDYCAWDGSYCSNAANTLYFQAGSDYLTDNHAWLPYQPTLPTIYCGAHYNGSQYASYASGNPSCDHPYSGGLPLTADEFVDVAATTHGTIAY